MAESNNVTCKDSFSKFDDDVVIFGICCCFVLFLFGVFFPFGFFNFALVMWCVCKCVTKILLAPYMYVHIHMYTYTRKHNISKAIVLPLRNWEAFEEFPFKKWVNVGRESRVRMHYLAVCCKWNSIGVELNFAKNWIEWRVIQKKKKRESASAREIVSERPLRCG